jgi:hypothetical protein
VNVEAFFHAVVETASAVTGLPCEELDREARRGPLALDFQDLAEVRRSLEERFGCRLGAPTAPCGLDVPATAVALGEAYGTGAVDLDLPVEYGVLLLKPDAARRGLRRRLPALLREFGLRLVGQKETRLDPEILPSLTHRRDRETLSYLGSGPVQILLVRGRDALERTYRLKHRARAELGVQDSVRNLLHACDAGNEIALFLRTFFPGQDEPRCRGSADQMWLPAGLEDLRAGLALIRENHPAGVVVPVLERGSPHLPAAFELAARYGQPYVGILERQPLAGSAYLETVCYLGSGLPAASGGGRALVGPQARLSDLAPTLSASSDDRFDFMLCYQPTWSLATVEELNDLARAHGIVPLCGSGASTRPFVVANSAAGMREFEAALIRGSWASDQRPGGGSGVAQQV